MVNAFSTRLGRFGKKRGRCTSDYKGSSVRREIEKIATEPILDLDDPEINVEFEFALQPRFNLRGIEPRLLIKLGEEPIAFAEPRFAAPDRTEPLARRADRS